MKQFKRVLPQLYMRKNGLQTLRFEIIQLSEQSASTDDKSNLGEFVVKPTDLAQMKRLQLSTIGILLRT